MEPVKLPWPGRPINLDKSRPRAYCFCSKYRWGCLDIVFSRLSFFTSLSHTLADGSIKTEILSQSAAKTKTTNKSSARPFGT